MTLMLTTRLKASLLERSEKREPFSKREGGDNMKKKRGLHTNFEIFDRDHYMRDMMKDPDRWLTQQRLSGVVSLIFIIGIVSLILLAGGNKEGALLCIAVGAAALPFFFIGC